MFFATLSADDKSQYRVLDPSDRRRMEQIAQTLSEESSMDSKTNRELEDMINQYAEETADEFPDLPAERQPRNDGFFQMGEREDIGPDDEFQEDDITSLAHGELEQHREIREYARLAGWEMPLLASLQVPFQPPTASTPLRFRYTSYMGTAHPASRKIVVEFDPSDLSLSSASQTKLIKLLGPRYNPLKSTAKLSCESFETQAQNKRYLGDVIADLIKEAKDLTTDSFEDIPLDFRHVKQKPQLKFPREWLLTEDRKNELERKRREAEARERDNAEFGLVVDGVRAIEEGSEIADLRRVEAPVMAMAGQALPKGKMGKKQMGQKGR